jgi:uncharacterized membrane protein
MIILAALIHLPPRAILLLGLVIVAGHNLLDPISFPPDHPLFIPWGVLHDRSQIELGGVVVKFNYPILPWIGVICLGWSAGSWFSQLASPERRRTLLRTSAAMIAGFVLLRALNIYGDSPWFVSPSEPIRTVMSFLALTKYPPSLLFLLPTLGIGSFYSLHLKRRMMRGLPVGYRSWAARRCSSTFSTSTFCAFFISALGRSGGQTTETYSGSIPSPGCGSGISA